MNLKESLSPIVFYYCSFEEFLEILQTNQFHLISNLGTSADRSEHTQGYHFYMSTARIYYGGYVRRNLRDNGVILTLDGDKLNQRYKAVPFDYWGPEYRKSAFNSGDMAHFMSNDENEDRIISNKESIPNALQYIKSVSLCLRANAYGEDNPNHLPDEDKYRVYLDDPQYLSIKKSYQYLQLRHIPMFIYVTEHDFIINNKKEAIKDRVYHSEITQLADYLSGKIPKDTKGRIEYNSRFKELMGALERQWEAKNFAESLANEIHNERTNPYYRSDIQIITNAMVKYRASSVMDLMFKLQKEYEQTQYSENSIVTLLNPLRLIN